MLENLSRYWWLVVLRGVAAVLFGILAIFFPGAAGVVLVIWFGAYVLIDGIFSLIAGISRRQTNDRWWVLVLEGLVGIAAGIVTFLWPGGAGLVLLFIIATWAILTGIMEIIAAIRLRAEIEGEWLLALGGVLSILFGVLLFIFPASGALAVIWLIAAYAILFGILLIVLGFRLRGRAGTSGTTMRTA
jgi:uncharacterized membrane protein HdeD (DUF308 family)